LAASSRAQHPSYSRHLVGDAFEGKSGGERDVLSDDVIKELGRRSGDR
jgi:hypothetical protein